eukprot:17359_3
MYATSSGGVTCEGTNSGARCDEERDRSCDCLGDERGISEERCCGERDRSCDCRCSALWGGGLVGELGTDLCDSRRTVPEKELLLFCRSTGAPETDWGLETGEADKDDELWLRGVGSVRLRYLDSSLSLSRLISSFRMLIWSSRTFCS